MHEDQDHKPDASTKTAADPSALDPQVRRLVTDKALFRQLEAYFRRRLHPRARRDAKDWAQTTLEKFIKSSKRPASSSDLRPYLFGIARNVRLDAGEKGRQHDYFDLDDQVAADPSTPGQKYVLLQLELSRVIREHLNAKEIEVLELYHGFRNYAHPLKTLKQVAEVLDRKANTVRSQHASALKKLEAALSKDILDLLKRREAESESLEQLLVELFLSLDRLALERERERSTTSDSD